MMLANYESYLSNFQILLSVNFIFINRYFKCKSKLFGVAMKVISKTGLLFTANCNKSFVLLVKID